jgi:error-prone DNA polymerase
MQNLHVMVKALVMIINTNYARRQTPIEGEVIHVIVERCYNISKMLAHLTPSQEELPKVATFAFPDKSPDPIITNKQTEKVFPDARNF